MKTNFIDTYKIEDLALINMKEYNSIIDGDNIDLFEIETEMTISDKIKFIDMMDNNNVTYLISLFELWITEKDNLPRQKGGNNINTNSKKAWIKKHDIKNQIRNLYNVGEINNKKSCIKLLNTK